MDSPKTELSDVIREMERARDDMMRSAERLEAYLQRLEAMLKSTKLSESERSNGAAMRGRPPAA